MAKIGLVNRPNQAQKQVKDMQSERGAKRELSKLVRVGGKGIITEGGTS